MQYLAFKYEVAKDIVTFGLMPLSMDCTMQTGYYNGTTQELVLISKDRVQEMKLIEKLDDFGQEVFKMLQGKKVPTFDRRTFETNLNFRLKGKDMDDFLSSYVKNLEVCTNVFLEIEKIKSSVEPTGKNEEGGQ